jgi:hypothetical protein
MKTLLISMLALMPIFGIGCQSITLTPTQLNLIQSEADIKTAARIATRVYILAIDDKAERAKTVKFANEVATQTLKSIENNTVSVEQVRVYASNLITSSNVKHKEAVGLLLDSVAVVVEERINKDLANTQGDERVKAVTALIKSATEGVLEATTTSPTTQP